ncbi:hypothetical protein QT972_09545, partial [Microcoleus sp. herbarium7]|uniref:hypothetical protein n=1 Tax=Microcoleus sp. herbarium7 TaxID=3055435 RepID=UPI002FCE6A56
GVKECCTTLEKWYNINSGCLGINITRNQDKAAPRPYNKSGVGKRHCRILYIIPVQPELI